MNYKVKKVLSQHLNVTLSCELRNAIIFHNISTTHTTLQNIIFLHLQLAFCFSLHATCSNLCVAETCSNILWADSIRCYSLRISTVSLSHFKIKANNPQREQREKEEISMRVSDCAKFVCCATRYIETGSLITIFYRVSYEYKREIRYRKFALW